MTNRKRNIPSHVYGIDPSINYCGISYFYCGKLTSHNLIETDDKPDADKSGVGRALRVYQQVKKFIGDLELVEYPTVVLEIPEYWGIAGYMSRESGAMNKLCLVAGMLATIAPDKLVTVVPSKWKGQLPKKAVRNRLGTVYPELLDKDVRHDVVDAVGLGHWYIYGRV